ncbi:hypothetical protein KCW65_24740, partial [Mycobacterium tuberculosis]|nr:hypothetical protein [Mycobacterium tuberculosis]
DMPEQGLSERWGGGYIASLRGRQADDARPGRARSWITSDLPLVDGEVDPPAAAHDGQGADEGQGGVGRRDGGEGAGTAARGQMARRPGALGG